MDEFTVTREMLVEAITNRDLAGHMDVSDMADELMAALAEQQMSPPPFDDNHYMYHSPAGPNPECGWCKYLNWSQP